MGSNYRWVPILSGKRLNYHDYFALTGSSVAFILAFICFVLNLIFRRLGTLKRHKEEDAQKQGTSQYRFLRAQANGNNFGNMELTNYMQSSQNINLNSTHQIYGQQLLTSSDNVAFYNNGDQNIPIKFNRNCYEQTADFFYGATYFFLTICPLVLGAFQVIWTSVSILLMIGIYAAKYYVDTHTEEHYHQYVNESQRQETITYSKKPSKKTIIAQLLYCILVPSFFHNTCLAFYNDNIGYYNELLGFQINTQFTRIFQLNDSCPPGPPCHLYATLPENTANDVFINIHTNKAINNVTVYYDLEEYYLNNKTAQLRNQQSSVLFELDYVESKGQRNVHSALISGLTPKTKYVIQIKYAGDDTVQATHFYRTLPDKNDPNLNITMINAGDAGNTEPARQFNQLVATLQPDIFFMGGDIAYDDNFNTCYYAWDFYLGGLEQMFNKLGYLLPMVWTVGNHDVGLNELPLVNVTLTDTVGPAYLTYFPQHYERDADFNIVKTVPSIINRRTVFHHEVANSVYLSLDSGYLHDFSGWQEKYIVSVLQNSTGLYKFANYHVPIYSACGSIDEESSPSTVRALFHWVPNFDTYRMATVYENHVHTFKRTYPMVGNKVVEKDGTVYLGDGAYGAIPFYCKLNKSLDIFAKAACINNFWVTQITQDKLYHRAYNREGIVMDSYEQDATYYRAV
ncbi:metallophosphoesterase (macronuclear) [Tetrahymena thermophila SB210]|uniref:Metallophosphoesterase n=1 Tax=Tetrahymena thermophila (strain SB210) TaxID=312017 RepID=Q24GM0_TETTS|nr:metallophosphoesterase [Tetrahymena thermophila SB210]EAS06851.1 metallophosphoesterase [Tetrahymena thermophila SB210]|eukprot:XP_001027093.1 metallophosphoesterase [Tetrahymena thermophila SB210]